MERRREILSARKRILLFCELTLRIAHAQKAEIDCKRKMSKNQKNINSDAGENKNDDDNDNDNNTYNEFENILREQLSFETNNVVNNQPIDSCLKVSCDLALNSKGVMNEFALKFISANTSLKDRNQVVQVKT